MEVLVDKKYINKIRNKKVFDCGKEGFCYLYDNGRIIKLFKEKNKPEKLYFDDLYHNQIAFPIEILRSRETKKIVGYTMNYLNGQKFYNGFKKDLTLENLKKCYFNSQLLLLKLKNIYMYDLCLENILYDYDKNIINIIDTSRWYIKSGAEIENVNEFNWQFMTALINSIDFKTHKLNHDKKLFELYTTYKYSEQITSIFIEFLNEIDIKVSEYKGEKVKKINDLLIK